MNNNNNLPNEIYDLIEVFQFNQLNNVQQKKVLEHITETEYSNLHKAYVYSQNSFDLEKQLSPSNSVYENLNSEFKKKHKQNIFVIENNWKGILKIAAAIILLFSTATIVNNYFMKSKQETLYVTVHDTIFVKSKGIEKSLIDTIVIYKERIINKAKNYEKSVFQTTNQIADSSERQSPLTSDFDIFQIRRLRENSIKNSGRSIAKDTLIRDIGFVKL